MRGCVVPLLGAVLTCSAQRLSSCDESTKSYERSRDPDAAFKKYGESKRLYPTNTVLGTCGEVDGFPSSISRPELWSTPMFSNGVNNHNMDLPIVKSYEAKGVYLDVFEKITVKEVDVDFFPGSDGVPDKCKPVGYSGTPIMSYSSATNGASSPGPTVKQCLGRQTAMKFCNEAKRPISVHLHGSASVAPYDGWADDVTEPGQCKEYLFPDNRAATLWYHDHAVHITADNAYAGLAGHYLVRDCGSDTELNYMPSDKFSIPFVLRDAVLSKTLVGGKAKLVYQGGRLNPEGAHRDYIFGDINMVNGKAWPRLAVEPRVYRFYWLDAAVSRDYSVKFIAENADGKQAWVDFYLVGTDAGLLQTARKLNHLYIAVSERYETLINFAPKGLPPLINGKQWKHVYAVNDFGVGAATNAVQFCKSHLLARFDIGTRTTDAVDKGADLKWPPPVHTSQGILHPQRALRNLISNAELDAFKARAMRGEFDRSFEFGHGSGPNAPRWTINNKHWGDEASRIIANPARDSIELWEVKSGGGWHHPIHIHLVDFLVLRGEGRDNDQWEDWDTLRQSTGVFGSLDPFRCSTNSDCPLGKACRSGRCPSSGCNSSDQQCPLGSYCMGNTCVENGLRKWEQDAPKDVVHLGNGQTIWVLARFGPHDGDYMFHCHSLVHEDTDMMLGFGVGREAPGVASPWVSGASAYPGDNKWAVPDAGVNLKIAVVEADAVADLEDVTPPAQPVVVPPPIPAEPVVDAEDSDEHNSADHAADGAEETTAELPEVDETDAEETEDALDEAADAAEDAADDALNAAEDAAEVWKGEDYVPQPGAKARFNPSIALSPYSVQFRDGTTNTYLRNAMSDRKKYSLADANNAVHYCARLREGAYDIFYPDKSVVDEHLKLRDAGGYELGDFNYNPLQTNLWTIDYTEPGVTNPNLPLRKLAAGHSTTECADKSSGDNCTKDDNCAAKPGNVCSITRAEPACVLLRPKHCYTDDHCRWGLYGEKCIAGYCKNATAAVTAAVAAPEHMH